MNIQQQINDQETTDSWDEDLLLNEKIKDINANRQDRKRFQICLLSILILEILFLMFIILSQAIKRFIFTHINFVLSDWEFVPFVNGCLFQTFILIKPIANNLFPYNGKEIRKSQDSDSQSYEEQYD